ncbi:Uncharacterized membrane protein YjcL [Coccomyxa sp. Obi]|nr:Uncharacterized membrane protein YjcL [Coccomyxa sp. Obi]
MSQPLDVWTGLALCSWASQAGVAQESVVGKVLGGPMLAIAAGMVCSSTGLMPLQSPVYAIVWEYLVPLASVLLLLEADLRELLSVARTTTFCFILAALATICGTFVAFLSMGHELGIEGWKIAACLCASYIGGSVNFSAVAASLQVSGPSLVAAMTADVTVMALYLGLISSIPVNLNSKDEEKKLQESVAPVVGATTTAGNMASSLASAAFSCSCGWWAATSLGMAGCALAFSALVASSLATLAATLEVRSGPTTCSTFAGAEALGGALMLVFFSSVGASAGSPTSLVDSGWLTIFIGIQLCVHLSLLLFWGILFKLPTQALLTASNAAIGGPATAAAMCTSRGWSRMVTAALLVGTLGYVVGTPIGVLVAFNLKRW